MQQFCFLGIFSELSNILDEILKLNNNAQRLLFASIQPLYVEVLYNWQRSGLQKVSILTIQSKKIGLRDVKKILFQMFLVFAEKMYHLLGGC